MSTIDYIIENERRTAAVIQLMEECAELIQACSKLLRVDGVGTITDVKRQEAIDLLTEEIADVEVTGTVVMRQLGIDDEEIIDNYCAKADRWCKRLEEEAEGK